MPRKIYLDSEIEAIEMENQLRSIRYWLKAITLLLVVHMYYLFFTPFGPDPLFPSGVVEVMLLLLFVIGLSAIASLILQLFSDISGSRPEI
jgi:hypothetical protein